MQQTQTPIEVLQKIADGGHKVLVELGGERIELQEWVRRVQERE